MHFYTSKRFFFSVTKYEYKSDNIQQSATPYNEIKEPRKPSTIMNNMSHFLFFNQNFQFSKQKV